MTLQRIYDVAPVWLQNAACSLQGFRLERQRYGREFAEVFDQYRERSFATLADIAEFRRIRLRQLMLAAASTTHFAALFREQGVDPNAVNPEAELRKLPVVTKTVVQGNVDAFKRAVDGETLPVHTSGTTGAGLQFSTTTDAVREQWAVWWRYRQWHGLERGEWCGYFGGRSVVPVSQKRPPFWRLNAPARQILFSAYHMTDENLRAYVQELRRAKPRWLHGYPSSLAIIATWMIENNEQLDYELRWITTGAENLLAGQRALILRAFGVEPLQHYGMAEGAANFSQCERGVLHVDEDFAFVEFLPSDGGGSRIVGTNLTNLATVFLRYDTGDIATLSDRTCDCGRTGRVVDAVDGRKEDYVVLKNGARVGRLDHIMKDMVNVREAQVVQKARGSVMFRIVKGPQYSARDEAQLIEEAQTRLGLDTEIAVVYVDQIERTRTGKLRFVVSEVDEVNR